MEADGYPARGRLAPLTQTAGLQRARAQPPARRAKPQRELSRRRIGVRVPLPEGTDVSDETRKPRTFGWRL